MDENLLERFFSNECSAEEQRQVLAWYLSGEADQELTAKIESYWKEEKSSINDRWGKNALFSSIEERIDANLKAGKKRSSSQGQFWKSWKNAAVIALFILATASWYHFVLKDLLRSPNLPTEKPAHLENFIVKKIARGEKLTLTLEDSTLIQLNSESVIRYKRSVPREVFLEGEAFFEVAHDTFHPFRIYTATLTTTVLGTSLNIKAFSNEDDIAVSVVAGKVKVEQEDGTQKKTVHLSPGEQAIYHPQNTAFAKKKFEYQEVLSWKDGRIYFKNANFSEVIRTLERWYGLEIEVQRKKIENGFSGSYAHRSLESVLEGMCFVLAFEYEIHDKKIIIK